MKIIKVTGLFIFFLIAGEIYSTEGDTMRGNDGKVYKTVQIGSQVWMAENLKETRYRNGDMILEVKDDEEWSNLASGARCAYDNNELYAIGYLYNWYALLDSRKIAPAGWRVPTDADWKELEQHLGMNRSEAENEDWRGINEGSKLAGNTQLWPDGMLKEDPLFGQSCFYALPAGARNSNTGSFYYLAMLAFFWTDTESGSSAWGRMIGYQDSVIGRARSAKQDGFSVRLIRK